MNFSDIINKIPKGNKDLFLTEEYYQLSQFNGEGTFEYFIFSDGNQYAIYPFLKNRITGFSCIDSGEYYDIQSAYGYGGILTNSYDKAFIQSFFEDFDSYCNENSIVAEFVRFHPMLKNHSFSSQKMTVIDDRETVIIDLSLGYDEIFTSQYTSKGRNVIRKGRKSGHRAEFYINPNYSLINKFHEIYSENMRSVNADDFYFFSLDYFLKFFKLLQSSAYLGVVYDQHEKILCSSIFLHYEDFFHYHLSGRVSRADNSVNNFMIDEAVSYGISLGAAKFHLGGGLSSNKRDKLFKFKASFSKERGIFKIGKRVHNKEQYDRLVSEWESKNPEKIGMYKNHLLKYRF